MGCEWAGRESAIVRSRISADGSDQGDVAPTLERSSCGQDSESYSDWEVVRLILSRARGLRRAWVLELAMGDRAPCNRRIVRRRCGRCRAESVS